VRVLVTGSKGLIGSNLCRALEGKGHEIIPMNFPEYNIVNLDESLDLGRIDQIYHLASNPSPAKYNLKLVETVQTNVQGSINILNLAVKNQAKVLLASTPDVTDYLGPNVSRSCYVDSKKVAEDLVFTYHRQYGLPIRIARIYSTYGPCMGLLDGRVIPEFILAAMGGQDIKIIGSGEQLDSFCYVDDMVNGLIRLMEFDAESDGFFSFELGYPVSISINVLASTIIRLVGSSSKIVRVEADRPIKDRKSSNIFRTQEILKWEPKVNLQTGLIYTIEHFRRMAKEICVTGD
jgi:UDP-glucuronate decarboxylase